MPGSGWLSLPEELGPRSSNAKPEAGAPFFDAADVNEPVGVSGHVNAMPMLGWVDVADTAPPMPTSLDPNAPRRTPTGVENGPLDKNTAKRIALKGTAEVLLRGQDDLLGEKAMQVLLEIPEGERGKAIDDLNDAAFLALLERVPAAGREDFLALIGGSKRADRKLHLWKEGHVSRAQNDVSRKKGDIGADEPDAEAKLSRVRVDMDPMRRKKDEDSWGRVHDEGDNSLEAFEARDAKRTAKQKDNLSRHERRVERAISTRDEVMDEVGDLYDIDGSAPDLARVDAMITRKEAEYRLEQKTDLNFTNEMQGENERKWEVDDLASAELMLGRLPQDHIGRTDGFKELRREGIFHGRNGVGGAANSSEHLIVITDSGVTEIDDVGADRSAYSHGGDARQGVSDEFVTQNSGRIGVLEYVLTHEIGHDVAARNPAAFQAFKNAAGYSLTNRAEMLADQMSTTEIAAIDRTVGGSGSNPGAERRYSATDTGGFEGVDHTALPYSSPLGLDDRADKASDSWRYSGESASEHFAEVYAKAVHRPQQLYQDLVERPGMEAKAARARVAQLLAQVTATPETPANAEKLAGLQKALDAATKTMELKLRAVDQRGGQFKVMREQVFHGDAAAQTARARLAVGGLDKERLQEFDREAAQLSTPEQIQMLEERYQR